MVAYRPGHKPGVAHHCHCHCRLRQLGELDAETDAIKTEVTRAAEEAREISQNIEEGKKLLEEMKAYRKTAAEHTEQIES